uniref:Uncharacterized protein n=1 Tax=Oryza meridionalis TaxID=40149 RepID=A0A0E0CHW7_9ORYZ
MAQGHYESLTQNIWLERNRRMFQQQQKNICKSPSWCLPSDNADKLVHAENTSEVILIRFFTEPKYHFSNSIQGHGVLIIPQ